MFDRSSLATTITLDLKKYRIRIFKAALHQIGDPAYIQLLVNPHAMAFAIKSTDRKSCRGLAHKVDKATMRSDNSIEIYSRSFIDKLQEVVPDLEDKGTYRIPGTVVPKEKMVVFSLKNIVSIES